MAGMEHTFDQTASETIDLLEARLRRIEFAVSGQVEDVPSSGNKSTASQRLADLEHSLHQLASKSRVIQELLKLHAKHPDLFQSLSPQELPTTLDTATILSIVMASASSYPSTSSRLTSITDVPIPPAELSAQLIELQPRIAKAEAVQAAQNADIAELRERTAALIQKWYTTDILRVGEKWAEVEGRVEKAEQRLRRVALAQKADLL
ncbi:uncharacterized protein L3040_008183 [Drepanopeziza brunnea f. sp. 'multigermtubi']|uniref:Nuclear distribution protein n=1 Tax=Marssonina brunnea f. sp. multigermtubi (strain MB_m1) TaxID=1072389 RepID=K1WV18_MARBU|nr:uncharacterized protein MBM_09359 [Drepanopeziza brunnea f. sp. 'multigermtubi' MB_m1]EKD12493.1 hypothetical protein MBM_09359 [Drepanopeziza brunnea f. sp. 'multigermtubi' MB_m1]KAJ5034915.1 hypothetical protein L3040_008183 [Drepanopeziza brunnea f. sp. 'multigermtubi']